MKSIRDIKSVGWGLFAILYVPLAPLGIWFIFKTTYDANAPAVRVLFGLCLAATVDGIITWTINHLLYLRNRKEYDAQLKEKKKKKKLKK